MKPLKYLRTPFRFQAINTFKSSTSVVELVMLLCSQVGIAEQLVMLLCSQVGIAEQLVMLLCS